ncbi:MAG: zinc-dependent alcohol dehydrogenase family protein [Anaerolineae bacterium]
MKAQRLHQTGPVGVGSLRLEEVKTPAIGPEEVLVKVSACGVCHTDLHLVEGDLPDPKLPVIPGHEVVGRVERIGAAVTDLKVGARVGITWLHDSCGECSFCLRGQENLCEQAHFTGYTADGGYAEYIAVPADFAVPLPDRFSDVEAAPLLCAGVVGFRSLRVAGLRPGERLGLYGFGASAHLCIQVARHWDCETYVFTRSAAHRQHARELGAAWVGEAGETPPYLLDRAVIFAPAGWIIPAALKHLRRGGTLAINAIHMTPIPEFPYHLLWHERVIRSVANVTRADAETFLPLAAEIPVKVEARAFPLAEANRVLGMVKDSQISGAAVLTI